MVGSPRMKSKRTVAAATAVWLAVAGTALAQEGAGGASADDPPAKGIQDNSFFLEEAYNQEPGVVQHITTVQKQGRDWFLSFTQEVPLGSQDHQFSYTLPYGFLRASGRNPSGFGDAMVNYRYQAQYETDLLPAVAPRFSLVLPTGNQFKGLGEGSHASTRTSPSARSFPTGSRYTQNVGWTTLLDVNGRRPTSPSVGASAVHAVTRDSNVLFEAVAESQAQVDENSRTTRDNTLTLSPGFRYAVNFPTLQDLQMVMGAAGPITLSKQKPDYGVLLYLSFEHKMKK